MSYPYTRICTGCKKVFDAVECTIDVGDFWNLSEELAWACTKKCAKDAKENWIKNMRK